MKIEAIAFYPINLETKKGNLIGTLHVRLLDYDIDIRGIRVFSKGKNLFFFQQRGLAKCQETGKNIHYPIFSFNSLDKNKELLQDLQHVGNQFLKSKFPECLPKKAPQNR